MSSPFDVSAADRAQRTFHDRGLETRRRVIEGLRQASVTNAERWALMAVLETRMGRVDDKTQKNLLCATRTPGVEDLETRVYAGDSGQTLVESTPFGVVAAITPSNNPAATIISNAIGILAAGNAVIFAPHPGAAQVCLDVVRVLCAAAVAAGAPEGLISSVSPASQEATVALLAHPGVHLNLVTGGPSIVKVAMTTGKIGKTIAAGPGNPPVVVDETADFPRCVQDIIFGASFDNNLICIAEKEVIVVEAARIRFLESMRRDSRAFELSVPQMDALAVLAILEKGMNRDFVGKDAAVIAKAIDLVLPDSVRLLWGEVPADHPFMVTEQLMPVLPVTFVHDLDSAIELACLVEGGNHHSVAMHSNDLRSLDRLARRLQCSLFVKNGSTLSGLGMAVGFASMSIGTPTGDGITKTSDFVRPTHYCRVE